MEFDREALNGILQSLTKKEYSDFYAVFTRLGGNETKQASSERMSIGMAALIEVGLIIPFEIKPSELAAEEYEDIMAAQELMK